MKRTFIAATIVITAFLYSPPSWCLDDKVCPCGFDPGGDCIPCKESERDISNPPKLEDDKTFEDVQCECGYDPGGGCVPCKDITDDESEKKRGE